MFQYYKHVLTNYAQFEGRARRAEYWGFVAINILIVVGLAIISALIGDDYRLLGFVYLLAVLVPSIAVSVRRLHDIGKSGWWLLINFVPIIGGIWYMILLVTDSQSETNTYGASPKAIQKADSSAPVQS